MTSTAGAPDPAWWRELSTAAGLMSLVVVLALWVDGQGPQELGSVTGALHATGRLLALLASWLLLVQVLLMARVPFLERGFGQDRIVRLHRVAGFTSFSLVLAHIVVTTAGYAVSTGMGVWGTLVDFVLSYPGLLLAVVALVALVLVVVSSLRRARTRLRYESWHLLHLYAYLGAGLAVPHQIWTGQDFTSHPAAAAYWWACWALAFGAVLAFRVGLPLYRSWHHALVVSEVRRETIGVTSVVVAGRALDRLGARGGQYFVWRFLGHPGWTRAHPFSLSAAPDGRALRLTAVHVGDGSTRLDRLTPGTRVLVEGPYGRLHAGVRTRRRVLLMASGIGVTPMRALVEELQQEPGDVVLVYRVHSPSDVLFEGELARISGRTGARVVIVPGPRRRDRASWLPASAGSLTDRDALLRLVPDVAGRDVYLCGNEGWMELVRAAVADAGVPPERVHLERFVW